MGDAGKLRRRANAAAALLAAVLAVLAGAARAAGPTDVRAVPFIVPQHFANTNVNRQIDLGVPTIVREVVAVTARNTASAPDGAYFVAFDSVLADLSLGTVQANVKGDKEKLVVEKAAYDATRGVQYYKINLAKPVPAGESVSLQITAAFLHATENLPKLIGQSDRASRVYSGNVHFLSPYTTIREKTTIKVPASRVHSHEPAASTVSGNAYIYSNDEVAPFSKSNVRFHFEASSPLLVLESATRRVQLSHWTSKVEVTEDFILQHDGPGLNQPFSRIDYARSGGYRMEQSTVASAFSFNFPAGAIDAWYRDVDGNISTSHFRTEAGRSVFEMRPRYPIYGGWKFSWMHGYEVPQTFTSKNGLVQQTKPGQYLLRAKVYDGLKNVPVDKFTLEVVLPEGATDIKVNLPFTPDTSSETRTYSYFDTVGKPTFIYTKKRFTDEMWNEFTVTYNFDSSAYMRKPLVIATGVFAFLAVVAILRRVDTSIEKDEAGDATKELRQAHSALEAAFNDYNRRHRDVVVFTEGRKSILAKVSRTESAMRRSSAELADLWVQRRSKVVEQQDTILALHKLPASEAEKRRDDVARKLDAIKADIANIDRRISESQ